MIEIEFMKHFTKIEILEALESYANSKLLYRKICAMLYETKSDMLFGKLEQLNDRSRKVINEPLEYEKLHIEWIKTYDAVKRLDEHFECICRSRDKASDVTNKLPDKGIDTIQKTQITYVVNDMDRCLMCSTYVPEGRQVCLACENGTTNIIGYPNM